MKENASDECENESYESVIDAHVFGGSVVDPWWILGGSGSFLVDPGREACHFTICFCHFGGGSAVTKFPFYNIKKVKWKKQGTRETPGCLEF